MSSASVGRTLLLAGGVAALLVSLAVAWIVAAEPRHAAAAPVSTVSVTATVSPDPVERLDRVTVASMFRAWSDIPEPLSASIEVMSAGGAQVLAMNQSGFRVPGQDGREVDWVWRVPDSVEPGAYTVGLKVVGMDSGRVYGVNDQAAQFVVRPRE